MQLSDISNDDIRLFFHLLYAFCVVYKALFTQAVQFIFRQNPYYHSRKSIAGRSQRLHAIWKDHSTALRCPYDCLTFRTKLQLYEERIFTAKKPCGYHANSYVIRTNLPNFLSAVVWVMRYCTVAVQRYLLDELAAQPIIIGNSTEKRVRSRFVILSPESFRRTFLSFLPVCNIGILFM